MNLNWRGTAAELESRIAALPAVLSGQAPDTGGAVQGLLLRVGLALLGKVRESYVQASMGGPTAFGQPWAPLAPATLAARRIVATPKAIARVRSQYNKMTPEQKALVKEHAKRLSAALHSRKEQNQAINVLRKQRRAGKITQKFFDKRVKLIRSPGTGRDLNKKAMHVTAGAYAKILRDTGRLLNSLSPQFVGSADQILRTGPGWVEVGSNVMSDSGVPILTYHTSPKPRKQKKDGSGPVLPRRKVLPDNAQDLPDAWMTAIRDEVSLVLGSREFWLAFLGSRAS
jgi:hypothetical protein